MKSLIVSIVVLISVANRVFGGSCPPANQIAPCTCVDNSIKCFAYNHELDLQAIFEEIAFGHSSGEQFFETFELTSNTIEELPADVFQGVVFRQLIFNFNPRLSCVSPRAFSGMEKYTTRFISTSTTFSKNDGKDCDIFLAMSGLNVLEIINITGSDISAIPAKAFHGRGGPQNNLYWINLSGGQGGSIKTIGANAFSELRSLRYVDLSHHLISKIETLAFSFVQNVDLELIINLEHNWDNTAHTGLNGETFGPQVFDVGYRRTTLKLGGNPGLKYLKQDPFYSFLQNKPNGINKIDMAGTFLDYFWQNQWLLEFRAQLNLVEKILNIRTIDGEEIWSDNRKMFTGTPTTQATTLAATNGTTVSGGSSVSTVSSGSSVSAATTAATTAASTAASTASTV